MPEDNIDIPQGCFHIIRVDGTELRIAEKPTLAVIHKAIGCESIDAVTLNGAKEIAMLVDDTGMIDGKPVNPKATALYHSVCRPGTTACIHGDVAIVNDKDFE